MISANANVALLWNTAARVAGSTFGSSRTRCTVSVLVAAAALTVSRGAKWIWRSIKRSGIHSDGVLHHGLRIEHL
ncbi:Uncharacterised protein [Mycobacterium tuberculosis]|nr:Uncharacterised protein [Mycobacterium tuberculosis]